MVFGCQRTRKVDCGGRFAASALLICYSYTLAHTTLPTVSCLAVGPARPTYGGAVGWSDRLAVYTVTA